MKNKAFLSIQATYTCICECLYTYLTIYTSNDDLYDKYVHFHTSRNIDIKLTILYYNVL